jgi:hypothetical protein
MQRATETDETAATSWFFQRVAETALLRQH